MSFNPEFIEPKVRVPAAGFLPCLPGQPVSPETVSNDSGQRGVIAHLGGLQPLLVNLL